MRLLCVLAIFMAFAVADFDGSKFAFEQEYSHETFMVSAKQKSCVDGDDGLNVGETAPGSGILVSMDDPSNTARLRRTFARALPQAFQPFKEDVASNKGLLELKTDGVKILTAANLLDQLRSLMAFRLSITAACNKDQQFMLFPFKAKHARHEGTEGEREADEQSMLMDNKCDNLAATKGNEIQITVDLPWAALMTSPQNPYAANVAQSFKNSKAWNAVQEFTNYAEFVKNDEICRQEARALLGYMAHYLDNCGMMKNTWNPLPKLDLQTVYKEWCKKCGGEGKDIFQGLVAHLRSTVSGKVKPTNLGTMEARIAMDRGDFEDKYQPNRNWNVPPRGDAQGWLYPDHPKVIDCLDALEFCTVKYAQLAEYAKSGEDRDGALNCLYNSHAGAFPMKEKDGYLYSAVEIRKAQDMRASKFIEVATRTDPEAALNGVDEAFLQSDCEGFSTVAPASVSIAASPKPAPKPVSTSTSISPPVGKPPVAKPVSTSTSISLPRVSPPRTHRARNPRPRNPRPSTASTNLAPVESPPSDCNREKALGLDEADKKCAAGKPLGIAYRHLVCHGKFACLK